MYGLKRKDGTRQTSTLDRASYDSCSAPGCHGFSWVDSTTKVSGAASPSSSSWGGSTAARAHSDDAFNEALAMRGYRIKLVSATGKYVIIGSRTARNRVERSCSPTR